MKWIKRLFGKLKSGDEPAEETPAAPVEQEAAKPAEPAPQPEEKPKPEPKAEPKVEAAPAAASTLEPTNPAISELDDGERAASLLTEQDEVFTDDTPTGQIVTQPDADETPTSEIPAQAASAEAEADVTAPTTVDEPYGPGSAMALAGGAAPAGDYAVKAKVASKLFHTKESANFGRLKADVWFKTTEDAERAGFTAWNKKTKAAAPKKAAATSSDSEAPHGEGSAAPLADGAAPSSDYAVKAKVASKLFHTKESANFGRLKADVWFKTTEDAERAGFTAWNAKAKAGKK